jgi:hypothetical protein
MIYKKIKKLFYTPLIFAPAVILLVTGCVERQVIPRHDGRFHREPVREQKAVSPPISANAEQITNELAGMEPVDETDDLLLPILTHVNKRILAYEKKLPLIEELEQRIIDLGGSGEMAGTVSDCRFKIEDILSRYNDLHRQLLKKHVVSTSDLIKGETVLNLWEDDFRFTESGCIALIGQGDETRKTRFTGDKKLINKKGQVIISAYEARDYWQVVDEYEKLFAVHGDLLPNEITFLYGQALHRIGQGADATRIFSTLLARVQTPEEVAWKYQLIRLVADMEFAHENFKKAGQLYGKIVGAYHDLSWQNQWATKQLGVLQATDEKGEEVREYADFLKSYLSYNPDRDGFLIVKKADAFINRFPHSFVSSNVDILKSSASKEAEQWYKKLIGQVNTLIEENKYQDALLTIEKVPRMTLPLQKQRKLADLADKIRAEDSLARAARQLDDKLLIQEGWNEGMAHLDSERYDQAIESFSRLLNTSDAERAKNKINEIANHAAREDRRRAAELFVRANRTHDIESKKKLLLASRQLLEDILIKYPQADVADKAAQNLIRLEREIYAIDPGLLSGSEDR